MTIRMAGTSRPRVAAEIRLPDYGIKLVATTPEGAVDYKGQYAAGVYLRGVDAGGVLTVYAGTSRHVTNRQAGHPDAVDWVLLITRATDPDFAFTADERKAVEYWLCAAASRAQAGGRVRCGNGTAPEDPGLPPKIARSIRTPVLSALQALAHPASAPGLRDLTDAAAQLLDVTAAAHTATIRPRSTSRGHGPNLVRQLMRQALLQEGDRL